MSTQIQVLAIAATVLLLVGVLELVRRRRLQERYALVWLASALVLLGLAIWSDALTQVSELIGIAYPPNALFLIAVFFILVLLLHFSVAVSRLTDQSKVLAQRLALLEQRIDRQERPRRREHVIAEPLDAEDEEALLERAES